MCLDLWTRCLKIYCNVWPLQCTIFKQEKKSKASAASKTDFNALKRNVHKKRHDCTCSQLSSVIAKTVVFHKDFYFIPQFPLLDFLALPAKFFGVISFKVVERLLIDLVNLGAELGTAPVLGPDQDVIFYFGNMGYVTGNPLAHVPTVRLVSLTQFLAFH